MRKRNLERYFAGSDWDFLVPLGFPLRITLGINQFNLDVRANTLPIRVLDAKRYEHCPVAQFGLCRGLVDAQRVSGMARGNNQNCERKQS